MSAPERSFDDALGLAYRHLGRRDRTVAEVREHLARKEVDEATAAAVVAELGEQGYLDDARYARRFAEDRRTLDGWGAERIARKLAEVGVDPDVVAATLADRDHAGELEAALGILRRRFPVAPQTDRDRERALAFLARRGYELDLAYDAVRALVKDAAEAA